MHVRVVLLMPPLLSLCVPLAKYWIRSLPLHAVPYNRAARDVSGGCLLWLFWVGVAGMRARADESYGMDGHCCCLDRSAVSGCMPVWCQCNATIPGPVLMPPTMVVRVLPAPSVIGFAFRRTVTLVGMFVCAH